MFATMTLLAALSSTALADDTVTLEGVMQARPDAGGAVGAGGGVRVGLGSLTLSGEGRAMGDSAWIGRATAALDVFGGSDRFDLTVGGFAGMTGGLPDFGGATPTYGLELGVGLNLGRVEARYRRAMGLTGPLSGTLSEDELRAGLRLGEGNRSAPVFDIRPRHRRWLSSGGEQSRTGALVGVCCDGVRDPVDEGPPLLSTRGPHRQDSLDEPAACV